MAARVVPLDMQHLYRKDITIRGTHGSHPADRPKCFAAAAEGKIRAQIAMVLPLSRAADAHRLVEAGENGKIVLDPTLNAVSGERACYRYSRTFDLPALAGSKKAACALSLDLGPKPHLGYTDSTIDRAAELRLDDAGSPRSRADVRAGAYVVGGEMIVATQEFRPRRSAVLDLRRRSARDRRPRRCSSVLPTAPPRFGVGLARETAEALKSRNDLLITDLRSIAMQGLVAPEHLPPLAEAKAMLHWHARHRYCSNCGAKSRPGRCRLEAASAPSARPSISHAPIRW